MEDEETGEVAGMGGVDETLEIGDGFLGWGCGGMAKEVVRGGGFTGLG